MSFGGRAVEVICNNLRALTNDLRDERTMEEFKEELEKIGMIHRVIANNESITVIFVSPQIADSAHNTGEASFQGERLKLRRARSRSRSLSVKSVVIEDQLRDFVETEKIDEQCEDRLSKLPKHLKAKVVKGTYDKGHGNMSQMVMGYITHLQRLEKGDGAKGKGDGAKGKGGADRKRAESETKVRSKYDGMKFYGKLIELKDTKFGFVKCPKLERETCKKDIFLHVNDNPDIEQRDVGHTVSFYFHLVPQGPQGRRARRAPSNSRDRSPSGRHRSGKRHRTRSLSRGPKGKGRGNRSRSLSRGKGTRKHNRSRSGTPDRRSPVERMLKSTDREKRNETPEEYHKRKLKEFEELNLLDEQCCRRMRQASVAAQQDVMEQGFFIPSKRGRNNSQVVQGRLRRSKMSRQNGVKQSAPEFQSSSPHRERHSSSSSSSSVRSNAKKGSLARTTISSRGSAASDRKSASKADSRSPSSRHSSPKKKSTQLRVTNIPKLQGDPAKYLMDLFSPYLSMLESAADSSRPITRAWMDGKMCVLEIDNFDVAESAHRILDELSLMHRKIKVELRDAYV
eukprot:GEMP01011406.1.p1 GENE.GEMP01011406.1~~GEMP01011406.1.p1  ORF type:complete len:568 (+),score=142.02 GEMP01011406.1:192-1895(+)